MSVDESLHPTDGDYCFDPYSNGSWNAPWSHTGNWSPPWNPTPTRAPTHWSPPWSQPTSWTPPWNPTPTSWSPAWAPAPTRWYTSWSAPTWLGPPTLYGYSAAGCLGRGCLECEGDCDTDHDCTAGLVCFQRDGNTQVPGCSGNGVAQWDYCVRRSTPAAVPETRMPTQKPASAPSTPIKNIGKDGCKDGSCRLCEGDCDSDADCGGGLRCFLRDALEPVPGCSGDGHGGESFGSQDYCHSGMAICTYMHRSFVISHHDAHCCFIILYIYKSFSAWDYCISNP